MSRIQIRDHLIELANKYIDQKESFEHITYEPSFNVWKKVEDDGVPVTVSIKEAAGLTV